MIVNLILNVLVDLLIAIFYFLPTVTVLPTVFGFDIDTNLVTGVGYMNKIFTVYWPLSIMFQGFLFIMGYFFAKSTLQIFLGSRTPGK